ncbi:DUF4190 domain-containing protein [Streptomyces sp. NPDC012461]|uniref:DUF4190 domain-containing protein n=1 Tax=unclassified Streptomyces TaxID=2593676 RepID=UPI001960EE86|nr:DUF4190 domain-containing protein [Streptomyces sp. S12]
MSSAPPAGPQQPYDPADPAPGPGGEAPAPDPFAPPATAAPPDGTGPAPAPPYGGLHGARPPAVVNGAAIVAFAFGLLCFVPLVGLVLGLFALWRIRRRGERGRGLAIAGCALSSVGLALWSVLLTTGAAAEAWSSFRDGLRSVGAPALRSGDCFMAPEGMQAWAAWSRESEPVSCAGEHDGEIFARVRLPDGRYPGTEALMTSAHHECHAHRRAYVVDPWTVPANTDVYSVTPTEESWDLGDREILCAFGNEDPFARLSGSLRRDESSFDADQLTFLDAAGLLDDAADRVPVTEPEDDLPGHTKWAEHMVSALDQQTGMLREHTWSAAAQRPVADLVEVLEEARVEWAAAAGAEDADTYYDHQLKGSVLTEWEQEVTARKALGLTSSRSTYVPTGG